MDTLVARAYEPSKATLIVTATSALMGVAALVVLLRVYTRKVIISQLGPDDYMAVASLLLILAEGATIMTATKYGSGRHYSELSAKELLLYFRTFYVSIVLYTSSLLFVKMTFLVQYYRLLAVSRIRMLYVGAIVLVACWSFVLVLLAIFTCVPVQGFWDPSAHSKCIPTYPLWYIQAGGNIATDVAIFLLPMPCLIQLKLPLRQRLLLISVFGIGFLTVIISAIRLKYLHITDDVPWQNVPAQLWSMGELTSGITCACLPTLRPLLGRFIPWLSVGDSEPVVTGPSGPSSGARSKDKDLEALRTVGLMTFLDAGSRPGSRGSDRASLEDLGSPKLPRMPKAYSSAPLRRRAEEGPPPVPEKDDRFMSEAAVVEREIYQLLSKELGLRKE